jgi:arylsulfatase A-like enzyme
MAIATGLALAAGACSREPSASLSFSEAPVIIVDIDTLRADHLGCYGYQRPTSPNIDAWSREAIRFEWTFSQAPYTPPSQSSIFTGLYPSVHGRISKEHVLRDELTTIAEIFSDHGYATGGFVDGANMASIFGMGQGFEVYDDVGGGLAEIGPKAAGWLREHAGEKFLLLIHTFDVHHPYDRTPEPFNSAFLDEIELPGEWFRNRMTGYMAKRRRSKYKGEPFRLTRRQVAYARATYDGGILHVDDWFGSFWKLMRDTGLDDRAIVVVISDHGEEFEEHDSVFHERVYSTVTRVPLLIRLPGGWGARSVEETVETIDLLPTLLDLVDIDQPLSIDGRSLAPFLEGRASLSPYAVSESPFFGRRIAVADHQLRLYWTRSDRSTELYEYRTDRREQLDVVTSRPDDAGRLMDRLEEWRSDVEPRATPAPTVDEIDQRTYNQLKALGYID